MNIETPSEVHRRERRGVALTALGHLLNVAVKPYEGDRPSQNDLNDSFRTVLRCIEEFEGEANELERQRAALGAPPHADAPPPERTTSAVASWDVVVNGLDSVHIPPADAPRSTPARTMPAITIRNAHVLLGRLRGEDADVLRRLLDDVAVYSPAALPTIETASRTVLSDEIHELAKALRGARDDYRDARDGETAARFDRFADEALELSNLAAGSEGDVPARPQIPWSTVTKRCGTCNTPLEGTIQTTSLPLNGPCAECGSIRLSVPPGAADARTPPADKFCDENAHSFGPCKTCGMPYLASRLEPPTANDIAWAARVIHDENISDTGSHPEAIHYGEFETCDAPSCAAVRQEIAARLALLAWKETT